MRKYNSKLPLAFALSLMASVAIPGGAGAFLSNTPGLPLPPAGPFAQAPWVPPVVEREVAPDADSETQRKPAEKAGPGHRQGPGLAPHKMPAQDRGESSGRESGDMTVKSEPPVRSVENEQMPGNEAGVRPGENFNQTPGENVNPPHGKNPDQGQGKLPGGQPRPAPDIPEQPEQRLRPKPQPTPWKDPAPRSHDRPWIDVLPDLPL